MMRCLSTLLLVMYSLVGAFAAEPHANGVVDAMLKKFLSNGEKIEEMRYAFLAKGLNVRSSGANVVPMMYLSVRENHSRRLDAYCRVRPVDDVLTEYWTMELFDDGDYYLRGTPSSDTATRKITSKSIRDADKQAKRLVRLKPWFQAIYTPDCMIIGFRDSDPHELFGLAALRRERSKLVNVDDAEPRTLTARFEVEVPHSPVSSPGVPIEITFDGNCGFMPTKMRWDFDRAQRSGRASTSWLETDGIFVPTSYFVADFQGSSHDVNSQLEFQWLFGDDVPPIDKSKPDWTRPYRDLFSLEFARSTEGDIIIPGHLNWKEIQDEFLLRLKKARERK